MYVYAHVKYHTYCINFIVILHISFIFFSKYCSIFLFHYINKVNTFKVKLWHQLDTNKKLTESCDNFVHMFMSIFTNKQKNKIQIKNTQILYLSHASHGSKN